MIELLTNKNAMTIGSRIENAQKIEHLAGRGGFGKNFLRIRVDVKMKEPLVPRV